MYEAEGKQSDNHLLLQLAGALKLTFILQRETQPLFGDWHTGLFLPLALHTKSIEVWKRT